MHSPAIQIAPPGRTGIIGLGGDFGDDRLGWWCIDQLRTAIDESGDTTIRLARAVTPAELWGLIEGLQQLILIDACQGLGEVGRILHVRWPAPEIAKLRQPFGHGATLTEVLELAARLGQLPEVCELRCVEGCHFQFGQPLSPEVESAGRQIVSEIIERLNVVTSHA